MARVIDVRGSGGELVVLGGALTLPTSANTVTGVLAGSLRYDAVSASVQLYNGSAWAQASGGSGGVASFNARSGAVTLIAADVISALGFTPLSSIAGGTGLTLSGGGTISLANTAVTPATYKLATITVDAQGRLTSASENALIEIVATDSDFGVSTGASDNTNAFNAWFGRLLSTGRRGYLPPGVYRCTQRLILDLGAMSTKGLYVYGAVGQQSVIDLTSVSAGPAFQITCSTGVAVEPHIEGISVLTNLAGVGVAIGLSSLADSINLLRFEDMTVTNSSASASAVALQMNLCNDCRVSVSAQCAGNGDALQLRSTSRSIIDGKFFVAGTGIHLTSGNNVGNVFIAPTTTQVNTSVLIDSTGSVNNNFIGGSYVWNNGSGVSVAAVNATAGSLNRFIGGNFASPGSVVTNATGVIVYGVGAGQELLGGLALSPTSGNATLNLTSAAGNGAFVQMQNAGVTRWTAGANSGTDWALTRYNDSGSILDTPISVNRSTGVVTIASLTAVRSRATLTAAGTTQGTATAIASDVAIVTTVASGTGVVLAQADAMVMNRGANPLLVYPPSSAHIEAFGTNAAVTIAVGSYANFIRTSATQFYVG